MIISFDVVALMGLLLLQIIEISIFIMLFRAMKGGADKMIEKALHTLALPERAQNLLSGGKKQTIAADDILETISRSTKIPKEQLLNMAQQYLSGSAAQSKEGESTSSQAVVSNPYMALLQKVASPHGQIGLLDIAQLLLPIIMRPAQAQAQNQAQDNTANRW